MSQAQLLEELLAKPVGPHQPTRNSEPEDFTRSIEVTGNTLTATIRDLAGTVNEGTAIKFLEDEGQNPEEWEATHFRKITYGAGMESVKFSFRRKGLHDKPEREPLPLDDLLREIKRHKPRASRPAGSYGLIVALGDMQFGKIDGDGVEGTLARTIGCINGAADWLVSMRKLYDIGHVHVAWMGDHIEGFQSQGGANVWRTQLTENEQIRLTRRSMLHALTTFAPLAERLTMAAVPGNHGEAVRFMGSGITRYDDSHDTESLIAVSDATQLNAETFEHVEFYVPETDELTVVTEVAGTVVAHAHGHQWRPGKHMEWWRGQAFNKDSAMHVADVLLAGHLHHEFIDTDGPRTFIQPPAMESESTWFKHRTGTTGAPGLVVAITKDGRVDLKGVIRA